MAVGGEVVEVEDPLEVLLNPADAAADSDAGAGAFAHQIRRGQMVGMGMGLQNPFDPAIPPLSLGQHLLDEGRIGQAGNRIVDPDGIHQCRDPLFGLDQHIAPAAGIGFVVSQDFQAHASSSTFMITY